MITKKTENIGFIIFERQNPVISNPFYAPILESVVQATAEKGYSLFISSDRDLRLPSGEIMLRKQVDGVILASQTESDIILNFQRKNIPVVLINYHINLENLYCIISDDYSGISQAIEYLADRGHKNIGLLSGRFTPFIYSRRYNAYLDAMRKHGLTPDFRFVQTVEATVKDAYMLVSSLLTQENRPTALLCTNDTIAVGAMKAVLRAGLRIPQDMSVIGYDNSDLCMICEPELTSVAVDMSKMGRLSVEYLLAQINGQTPDQKIVTVDSKLILRGTTN
jgi:DNA-binding LacI/PurR family transcriptional regulator